MQALPYLQIKEPESAVSPEKKSYRLSLHEVSSKTAQFKDGQSKSGRNVNRPECSRESNGLLEGTSSIYFGDIAPYRTPAQSPSPSKSCRRPTRSQNQSSLPTWLDPLGVWLPSNKKTNCYETFIRNAELLRRTSDMFLDPCPHVPRCSHERTLSALKRQQRRMKTDDDLRKQERHRRIVERIQKIRDMWDQWSNQSKSSGTEHDNRLNNFRKNRDGYVDPDEVIKKKREERREREKVIRLEQAKKREEILSKQRFKLPKIVVSQYEEPETLQYSRPQSLTNERQSVLPSLVNIPSGLQNQIDKENDESEVESQGSKGDSLALPELESSCQERNYFENTQQGEEQVDRIFPELEQKVPTKADTDVTDSISQGIECSVETVEGKNVKTLLDNNNVVRLDLQIELESDIVSESVDAKVDEQIVLNRKKETVDTERSHQQQEENINSVDVSSTEFSWSWICQLIRELFTSEIKCFRGAGLLTIDVNFLLLSESKWCSNMASEDERDAADGARSSTSGSVKRVKTAGGTKSTRSSNMASEDERDAADGARPSTSGSAKRVKTAGGTKRKGKSSMGRKAKRDAADGARSSTHGSVKRVKTAGGTKLEVERNAAYGAMRVRTPEGTEAETNGAWTARIKVTVALKDAFDSVKEFGKFVLENPELILEKLRFALECWGIIKKFGYGSIILDLDCGSQEKFLEFQKDFQNGKVKDAMETEFREIGYNGKLELKLTKETPNVVIFKMSIETRTKETKEFFIVNPNPDVVSHGKRKGEKESDKKAEPGTSEASNTNETEKFKEGVVTYHDLQTLGKAIAGKWMTLARQLPGIEDADIEGIEHDHNTLAGKGFNMLNLWKKNNSKAADYKTLYYALDNNLVQRKDLAQEYCLE